MDKKVLNVGDPVIIGTVPEGKFTNNRTRKIQLQRGTIVQLCKSFAAVNMGKYIECFSYDRIQRAQ